ncbi:MAG: 50S ribosomal protein L31e [Thermoplasmatota archaeon]
MADNELERIYTIPLRKAHHGTRSKRANRAIRDVRNFLTRHMKSEDIWLDNEVNEALWSRGKFRIPSRIRVRATRFADGVVEVTLPEQEAAGSARAAIAEKLEKAAEAPVLAPMGLTDEDETEGAKEAVTALTGIGPATAAKLEKVEIETVGDLARADVDEVAQAIGKSKSDVQAWIDQAIERSQVSEEPVEETDAEATETSDETGDDETVKADGGDDAEATDDSEE